MSNIVNFPVEGTAIFRSRFSFVNRNVRIRKDDGMEFGLYPCIVLMDVENNIPVAYTGYERFIHSLADSEIEEGTTLSKRAFEICKFLNYILHEKNIDKVCDCSLNDIRDFMKALKYKADKSNYAEDTWNRMNNMVFSFLRNYYVAYKEIYCFKYNGEDLQKIVIIKDKEHHRRIKIVNNSKLKVSAPRNTHKKNRALVYGYLEHLLYETKKYDPMLTLAIALQSYAGLREGEVMNLTCGRVKMIYGAFSSLNSIELDLTSKAPFWVEYNKNTPSASFKPNQYRVQKVYYSFISKVKEIYDLHICMLETKGYPTRPDSPLFVNKQGNPMTVQTYTGRVKDMFYSYFLPSLKQICVEQNTWAENAAYIEAYELEYPGAHMFRHWFTMYLITKAKLPQGEIMKWRNDHSPESMSSYIHENSDIIDVYEKSAYRFQENILEEINRRYGKQ